MKKIIALTLALCSLAVPVIADEGVNVVVNNKEIEMKGTIVDNRTLVPVRGIFEGVGFDVSYDSASKTATLKNDNDTIIITQGKDSFTINNKEVTPDVPQQIINDRFMLPLRAVGEAIGAEVNWNSDTKTASLNTEKKVVESVTETTSEQVTNSEGLIKNPDGSLTAPGVRIEIVPVDESLNSSELVIGGANEKTDININK